MSQFTRLQHVWQSFGRAPRLRPSASGLYRREENVNSKVRPDQ
jgi:hypothetical protein